MNIERLKVIVDEWFKYIEKQDIEELEKDIEMPLKDFIIDLLQNMYNYYKDDIEYIPVGLDANEQYIIKPVNGRYSLEDFLINRLLRNISEVRYISSVIHISSYESSYGGIDIDEYRMKKQLKDVDQRRKLVAHELLHGLKTQFNDSNVFNMDEYFSLKERLKEKLPNDVNDFSYTHGIGENGSNSHIGLNKKNDSFNMENLDETFNEVDAIRFSNDKHNDIGFLNDNVLISLSNLESSNALITNYAYIIEMLLDKKVLFVSMYLKPDIMISIINKLYNPIFQKAYNSSKSAIEIISSQMELIKQNPRFIESHIMLLETLYECIKKDSYLIRPDEDNYNKKILYFACKGLLEMENGKFKMYSGLSYSDEFEAMKREKAM